MKSPKDDLNEILEDGFRHCIDRLKLDVEAMQGQVNANAGIPLGAQAGLGYGSAAIGASNLIHVQFDSAAYLKGDGSYNNPLVLDIEAVSTYVMSNIEEYIDKVLDDKLNSIMYPEKG